MPARRLDGRAIASAIREDLRPEVAAFTAAAGRPPGLALVLVGNLAASEIYVSAKVRAADDLGVRADVERLPADASLDQLLDLVARLNRSDVHDGILVQAPLPEQLGSAAMTRVFDAIDPAKDVDGFNPVSVGRLVQGRETMAPCTPSGIIEMLDRSGIEIRGRRAVVLGRSDIVGKPVASLLLRRDATVTVCHSKTRDLPAVASSADILVAAIGRPGFVTAAFVKPGATVVDVGINRLTERADVESMFGAGSERLATLERRGSVVAGDVHPDVADVAGALTPVPGGVGPLTIAMLVTNTVRTARARTGHLDPV